jgi:hypothetical protein
MALIVEDGTGQTEAESYITVAQFKTYADGRGYDYSTVADSFIEQKLRLASGYIDSQFRFKGNRKTPTQALEFPRLNLIDWSGYDIQGLPKRLKDACAELAFKALTADLYVDQNRGGKVKSESVGPLSVTYADDAPTGTVWQFAWNLLKPYVRDPEVRGVPFFGAEDSKPYFQTGMTDNPGTSPLDPAGLLGQV